MKVNEKGEEREDGRPDVQNIQTTKKEAGNKGRGKKEKKESEQGTSMARWFGSSEVNRKCNKTGREKQKSVKVLKRKEDKSTLSYR